MTALPTCPHCFAPVRSDGRPTCLCAAVDAEDFDPLRIRPYVSLPDGDEDGGDGGNGDDGGATDGGEDGDGNGRGGVGGGPGGGGGHKDHDYWGGPPWGGRGDHLDRSPGEDAAAHTAGRPLRLPAAPDPVSAADPLTAPPIPGAGHGHGPSSRTVGSAPEDEEATAGASGRSAPASSRRRRALPAALAARQRPPPPS